MDFIAIDFETANSNMSSACSLGLVCVKDNTIVKSEYYIMKPPNMEFDEINVKIHGITPEMVKNRPHFPEIWNEIKHYFNGNIIIAHNSHFDMSVLRCVLDEYKIDLPDFKYYCSIPISSEVTGTSIKKSLKERAKYFGINLTNHHNALDDATACAEIVLETIQAADEISFASFCLTYPYIDCNSFSELSPQTKFGSSGRKLSKYKGIRVADVVPTEECFNKDNPFYEKNVVLTGDLSKFSRKEALQLIVNLGGTNKSGVSRKVNFLIVGTQDPTLVGEDGHSTKEKKAFDLIEKGFDIKIIKEDEFYEMLTLSEDI